MNTESKATKYDWSNVPPEVKLIATDSIGVSLWAGEITRSDLQLYPRTSHVRAYWGLTGKLFESDLYKTVKVYSGGAFGVTPYQGDWRESLEHRPSPCAQCPNVGHKTCCCEVR